MDNKEQGNKQDQHGSQNVPGGQQGGQKPTSGQGSEKRTDEHTNRPGGSGSGSQGQGSQGSSGRN